MRTLVAILAMSSSAIFAQTHSPAQPASTPTLQASLHPACCVIHVVLTCPRRSRCCFRFGVHRHHAPGTTLATAHFL